MPIRVLVISNYNHYHPTRGEAEIFKQLSKMGYEIHIMTFKQGRHMEEFKEAGIHVIDFHPIKRMNRSEIRYIRNYAQSIKPDIVYLFNSRSILNGIQAVKNLDVKVVLYRGLSANVQWYDPTMYLKFYHPCVDMIVCNSIGVEKEFLRQGKIDPAKLITINKGHRVEWYSTYKPYPIRDELSISKSTLLLINVAVNRKMKGIPYLLKAMALLHKETDVHLLLVGSDMDNATNMKIIRKHKLKDKVTILGYRNDALNIMASCDVKVLPSISSESITKAVIEAMCLEVTPLISDIPGNEELVVNGESGIVFPSKNTVAIKDAIINLEADRGWCERLGKKAKQRVAKHLHIDQTIKQTDQLFKELVSESKNART